jgi:hypothetical protein
MSLTQTASLAAALTLICLDASRSSAQTTGSALDPQARSRAIAASFSKFKSLSREKHGIKKEKYLKVESQPVVKANREDYSGTYAIPDLGLALHLRADHTGNVEGDGYEPLGSDPAVRRAFTLKDGKIDGALLTATKSYTDGDTEQFEAVFMNRTSFESPTDTGFTRFGLGALGRSIQVSGLTIDKFFYELKSP